MSDGRTNVLRNAGTGMVAIIMTIPQEDGSAQLVSIDVPDDQARELHRLLGPVVAESEN